ncbi:MAG: CotH kinase family protein [Bacteroidia bacterium]
MLKKYFLPACILFFFSQQLPAQGFGGLGDTIPDDGNSIDFLITVSGLPNTIDTANFGLETVCINLTHTWDSDLDITLIAPDGTQALLTSGNGGDGDDYINTCFNQTAALSIVQGTPPFTGNFRPQGQIGVVNNGQNPNGIWRLHIQDTYPFADFGILYNWLIVFSNSPAGYFGLDSSSLPIVVINTFGQSIINDPKITAHMGIIDNGPGVRNYITDPFNNYDGMIGIETRGHSSQSFPQKQYGFETRDTAGNNLNTSLLGMPPENDWILYAPYTDKSCMRNRLTYMLSNDIGQYAVRGKFCELVLNGEYKGIYEITETVKRDSNRVHIAKMTAADTSGDDVTGGYIVKVDWVDGPYWTSSYPPDPVNPWNNIINFQCVYPKPSDIVAQQQNYIQMYVDSFEDAMASPTFTDPLIGWRHYADENSFIDFFINNEVSKNVDGYRLSTFFYKDKGSNGGLLKMGPVWDFNLAWRNADYCNNASPSFWAYRITDYCQADVPFWWKRLMLDTQFRNHLKCRWTSLRSTILDTAYIFNYIDSIQTLLDEAQQRHFTQWAILGTYVWPNPAPLANTYQEEIDNTKQWIIDRVTWMDANMPGTCSTVGTEELAAAAQFSVYPNPAANLLFIQAEAKTANTTVMLQNSLGRQLLTKQFKEETTLDISALPQGIYFVTFINDKYSATRKVVKE